MNTDYVKASLAGGIVYSLDSFEALDFWWWPLPEDKSNMHTHFIIVDVEILASITRISLPGDPSFHLPFQVEVPTLSMPSRASSIEAAYGPSRLDKLYHQGSEQRVELIADYKVGGGDGQG